MDSTYIATAFQGGGDNLMVCGIMPLHCIGHMICVEESLNTQVYLSIIAESSTTCNVNGVTCRG